MISTAQQVACKQAILGLELRDGEGRQPGMIWRFVRPDLVSVAAELHFGAPLDFDYPYPEGPAIYTATVRGVASGLYVADMGAYFAGEREAISERRLELGR